MLKILADILDDEYNIHIEATDLPPIHIHNQRRPSRAFFSRASFSQVYGHTMGPINCGIGGQQTKIIRGFSQKISWIFKILKNLMKIEF